MPILNVELSKDQEALIDHMLRSGRYRNSDELIETALRLLRSQVDGIKQETEFLRTEYALGKASGEPAELDAETFLADLRSSGR